MSAKKKVPVFLAKLGVTSGDWQFALHSGFEVLMRPGWDMRVRVYACLQRHSFGFNRDLAVWSVRGKRKGDPPVLLPLFPGGIINTLHDAVIDAFRESVLKPTPEQLQKIDKSNMRRLLESLEVDDGAIVRVRVNAIGKPEPVNEPGWCQVVKHDHLAPHWRTRKRLLDEGLRRLVDEAIPLKQAIAEGLVTPLANLSASERRRCNNSVIYVLAKPKPASERALNRRPDVGEEARDTKAGGGDPATPAATGTGLGIQSLREELRAQKIPPAARKKLEADQDLQAIAKAIDNAVQASLKPLRAQLRVAVQTKAAQMSLLDETANAAIQALPSQIFEMESRHQDFDQQFAAAPAKNGNSSAPPVEPESPTQAQPTPSAAPVPGQPGDVSPASTSGGNRGNGRAPAPNGKNDADSGVSEADKYTVGLVMRRFCPVDDEGIELLISRSRERQPRATVAAIAEALELKGPIAHKKAKADPAFNAVGWLVVAVPKALRAAPSPADDELAAFEERRKSWTMSG